MKAALREEDRELKPTKGWATVGDVAAGVAQNMVPIAAGVAFPPAAPALGVLNVGSLAGQNYAQAQKKVDRYEEMNDIKVPEVERMSYALFRFGDTDAGQVFGEYGNSGKKGPDEPCVGTVVFQSRCSKGDDRSGKTIYVESE